MMLLIDNYDSFSYNLYQLVGEINPNIRVIRSDEMTVAEIEKLKPTHIILSPGSGKPIDAGVCIEVVKQLGDSIPILGVCLGHQAIYEAYGGVVSYAKTLMHGKQSEAILNTSCQLFSDINSVIKVARYHSLAAITETLPSELEIIARTNDDEIMAVAHKTNLVFGLQFHPESILTTAGDKIIKNFLEVHYD